MMTELNRNAYVVAGHLQRKSKLCPQFDEKHSHNQLEAIFISAEMLFD
jgi:hypothetical protein